MSLGTSGILSMLRQGSTIKIIGDSISAGQGTSDSTNTEEIILRIKDEVFVRMKGSKSWSALFDRYLKDKFPNSILINNGCGGITSTQVRENLTKLYSEEDDIVIIMLGTNDRKQQNGMNILFENLSYIVSYLKDRNKKVILMSPNPSTNKNESYFNRLYHMEDVNNIIEDVSKNQEVEFISHYNYIQEYLLSIGSTIDEIMIEENCQNDGLHPTDKVHYLIFKNIIQSLKLGVEI